MCTRRRLLQSAAAATAWWLLPGPAVDASDSLLASSLDEQFSEPILIDAIEVLRLDGKLYVQARSRDGAVGVAAANDRLVAGMSLLKELVIPALLGRDARHLEALIASGVYNGATYKYVGMPFWNAVAHAELALWDLLGKLADRPAATLIAPRIRDDVGVYVSRFDRDSSPEQEVAAAAADLEQTGARAVKLKIGRRLHNTPAQTRRDLALTELARRRLGDDATIYVDANSSYTADEAIAIANELHQQGVAFLEEPCHWEDYEATRRVTAAVDLPIAGGEQDSSLIRFRWMIAERCVDIVQPDLYYHGGLLRTLRVARWAHEHGMTVTPHSPKVGELAAAMLQLASITPNIGPHLEYRAAPEVRGGRVEIPRRPGLGFEYDPRRLAAAERV